MLSLFARAQTSSVIGARLAHWRSARSILAAVICCAYVIPAAADPSLSLQQATALALERSRQLVAQDMAVSAVREMAVVADQLPDPVLSVGIDNVPVSGPDRWRLGGDFMTMRRVGISQEWTRAEKRRLRADRLEREAQQALAGKDLASATIERDVALAWLERYYAEAMTTVIDEQLTEARLAVEAAQAAYRGGKGSQADVYAARAEVVRVEDQASENARRVRNATTMLGRWVGSAASARLGARPPIDTLAFDPAHLVEQLARHPEMAVLAHGEEIAQAEIRLAEANKRADWNVELGYQHRGSGYPDMISFGVSIPLQWDQKRRQDREVAARLAQGEQAKALRDEALRQNLAQSRALVDEWTSNRDRRKRYETELVPLAQQRTIAELTAYRGGKTSLGDVIASRRAELDVRLQALQLDADMARVWAQLHFLVSQGHAQKRDAITTRSYDER